MARDNTPPNYEKMARNDLRYWMNKYGKRITPAASITFNNAWRAHLERDPSGKSLIKLVADFGDLLEKRFGKEKV